MLTEELPENAELEGGLRRLEAQVNDLGQEVSAVKRKVAEVRVMVQLLQQARLSPSERMEKPPANLGPRVRHPGLEMIEDDQDLAGAMEEAEANRNPHGETGGEATVSAGAAMEAASGWGRGVSG